MNKSNKEEIRKNAFAAMDAAAESEIQETGADLIVATEDLREAVKRMRGIVPKKGKLPILNCMLIQTDCSGNFCAKVTDLETTLKYTGRKVTGKLANAIPRLAIPFGSLASLLPHIRTEHTAFFMMRHGTITIRSGSLKAELKIMNVEDYPEEIGFENAIKFHAAGSLIDELANATHCTAIDVVWSLHRTAGKRRFHYRDDRRKTAVCPHGSKAVEKLQPACFPDHFAEKYSAHETLFQ